MTAATAFSVSVHANTPDTQHSVVAVEPNLVPVMQALVDAKGLEIDVKQSMDIPSSLTNDNMLLGISSRKWQDNEIAKFTHLRDTSPQSCFSLRMSSRYLPTRTIKPSPSQ